MHKNPKDTRIMPVHCLS